MFFQGFFLLFTSFSNMILVNYTKMTNIQYIFVENSRPPAIFSGTPRNFEAIFTML